MRRVGGEGGGGSVCEGVVRGGASDEFIEQKSSTKSSAAPASAAVSPTADRYKVFFSAEVMYSVSLMVNTRHY